MARVRQEDALMKIPAMEHLAKLGYAYLPRKSVRRDRGTGILPETLRAAVERINGAALTPERMDAMMGALREALNADDLGQRYYRMIREGWDGLKLIDYAHPEKNIYQQMTEAVCRNGKSLFRPDITLFVNGLPLAMIEVKTRKQNHGVRAEYDRMLERFRNPELRPFVQGTQVWAISNGRENDSDRLLPTEGSCYAATARGDFPLHAFSERHPGIGRRIGKANPEMIRLIREDNGLLPTIVLQAETREMLTGLFFPERFLFLMRYGIRYETELDENEEPQLRKRILSAEQLFILMDLQGKMRRGFRNCAFVPGGRAGEGAMIASLVNLARDTWPGARVYWALSSRKELLRADAEMRENGLHPGRRTRTEEADVILMEPAINVRDWLREPMEKDFVGRRVVLLPTKEAETENLRRFRRELRRVDPGAILISGCRCGRPAERSYIYFLECADGSLYCGWTNDLQARVAAHNEGRGAKYTRSRRPVRLVYYEEYASREEAMSREWHLKQMTRAEKLALIAAWRGSASESGKNESGM